MNDTVYAPLAAMAWHRLRLSIAPRFHLGSGAPALIVLNALVKSVKMGADADPERPPIRRALRVPGEPAHALRRAPGEPLALEILFFGAGDSDVEDWAKSFAGYLAENPKAHFDWAGPHAVHRHSGAELLAAPAEPPAHAELEFLSPLPFKRPEGAPRTHLTPENFLHPLHRRVESLFGLDLPLPDPAEFELSSAWWEYRELRHASKSQPGHTQYFNGGVGSLYFRGNLAALLPWLRLAEAVHAGGSLVLNALGYCRLHLPARPRLDPLLARPQTWLPALERVQNAHDDWAAWLAPDHGVPFEPAGFTAGLARRLTEPDWQPAPALVYTVPKTGGTRRLEKFPLPELVLHTGLFLLLREPLDRTLEPACLGYRPGRSVQTALARVTELLGQGYRYAVQSDIEDFFPSVGLDRLLGLLDRLLPPADARLREILTLILRAPCLDEGRLCRRDRGLAQGSPLSPLFANLYLDRFDEILSAAENAIEKPLSSEGRAGERNEKPLSSEGRAGEGNEKPLSPEGRGVGERGYLHRQEGSPFHSKTVSAEAQLVRYADDFVMLTRTREQAAALLDLARRELAEAGLALGAEDTAIRDIEAGFRFLGQPFGGLAAEALAETLAVPVRKTVYVTEPGCFLGRNGDALEIRRDGRPLETLPLRRISDIAVMAPASFSSGLVKKCATLGIPLVFTLESGYHIATLTPDSRRHHAVAEAQSLHYARLSPTERLALAKSFAGGKIENYKTLVAARYRAGTAEVLAELDGTLAAIEGAADTAAVRGHEGHAARIIFRELNGYLKVPEFRFQRRDRKLDDPMNSLFNFGYYLLFTRLNTLVRGAGLNPYLGFLHDGDDDYESLVCDIEELFRAPVDRLLLSLVNLKIIGPGDFHKTPRGLRLQPAAAKRFLLRFEEMLRADVGGLSLLEAMEAQVEAFRRYVVDDRPLWYFRYRTQGAALAETAPKGARASRPSQPGAPAADEIAPHPDAAAGGPVAGNIPPEEA